MKKTVGFLIAICLLFGSLGNYTFAERENRNIKDIEIALDKLEKQRDKNLELIKEQLEEQDMMEHYDFHAELVDLEYQILKDGILGLDNVTVSSRRIYLRNGGQIEYRAEPDKDPRTHAYFVIDAYNKEMTADIIDKYDNNNRTTFADINRYIINTILGWKIPMISPLLVGIEGGVLLRDYLTSRVIDNIENSNTKCLLISSVSHYGGKSTVWRVWEDMPYVAISPSATQIQITPF